MDLRECMEFLASRRKDELVITSAGTSSQVWWDVTGDMEQTFHLTASMSMATQFAAGIALGLPSATVWAFMGDGSFHMNPGTLIVERELNLPNLRHFLVANDVYGANDNAALPGHGQVDYPQLARAFGIDRVFDVRTLEALSDTYSALAEPGYAFVVLHVQPLLQRLPTAQIQDIEAKFKFARHVERTFGVRVI